MPYRPCTRARDCKDDVHQLLKFRAVRFESSIKDMSAKSEVGLSGQRMLDNHDAELPGALTGA